LDFFLKRIHTSKKTTLVVGLRLPLENMENQQKPSRCCTPNRNPEKVVGKVQTACAEKAEQLAAAACCRAAEGDCATQCAD
jgi:hypothetical protein